VSAHARRTQFRTRYLRSAGACWPIFFRLHAWSTLPTARARPQRQRGPFPAGHSVKTAMRRHELPQTTASTDRSCFAASIACANAHRAAGSPPSPRPFLATQQHARPTIHSGRLQAHLTRFPPRVSNAATCRARHRVRKAMQHGLAFLPVRTTNSCALTSIHTRHLVHQRLPLE